MGTVPKQPLTDEFGANWSKEKLLCYWVLSHVINTRGHLEFIQEEKLNEGDLTQAVQVASVQINAAMEAAKELYQIICQKEREATL